jgi:hypothetical protein
MFDFLLDLLWHLFDIPFYTGKFLVFVFTLGQVHCEDNAARVIGWIFWIVVFVAILVLAIRR